jgi:DNA-binding protein YbaB
VGEAVDMNLDPAVVEESIKEAVKEAVRDAVETVVEQNGAGNH